MPDLELRVRPLITPETCPTCGFPWKTRQGKGRHLSSQAGKNGHPLFVSTRHKVGTASQRPRGTAEIVGAELHGLASTATAGLAALIKWADTTAAENVILKRANQDLQTKLDKIKQTNSLIFSQP